MQIINFKITLPKPRKNHGFTLIEMLISITIFMLFLGIVAGSYTTLVSANRKANDAQKTYSEVRYILGTLAGEILNGKIDYSCIDESAAFDPICLSNQGMENKTVLAILRNDGTRSVYKFSENKFQYVAQKPSLGGFINTADWQSLTTDALKIEDISFKVFPLKNPYASANAADDAVQLQPTVTITLKAAGITFRTTYTSRSYGA